MKIIELKSQAKRKKYQRNFRIGALFSIVFDKPIDGVAWEDIMLPLGYTTTKGVSKFCFNKGPVDIDINDNTIFVNCNPQVLSCDERIAEIIKVLNQSWDAIGQEPSSVCAGSVNSYVLDSYKATKEFQKRCINYFFKQMDGDTSSIILNPTKTVASIVEIKFDKNHLGQDTLGFSIISILKDPNRKFDSIDRIHKYLEQLCKENYSAWRAIVSDNVIKVMEGGE